MRRSHRDSLRRGAVAVEAAFVLPVFLILVLGILDLGLAVMSHNALSEAARTCARQAIVQGELAPSTLNGGPWQLPNQPEAAAVVAPLLSACPLDNTQVLLAWPDGNNKAGSRVQVTVEGSYQPVVTYIFGRPAIRLSASSTMLIAH